MPDPGPPDPSPADDPYGLRRSPYDAGLPRFSEYVGDPLSGGGPPDPPPPPDVAAPLRVVHVGQSLVRVGGIETVLKGLFSNFNPDRVRVTRCVITQADNFDPRAAAELGVPVELGGADVVRAAARDADVLLFWGPREMGQWLCDGRPPVCVFVAHGHGYWTHWIYDGCAPVADHVVAVSERVRASLRGDVPVSVIPNGVDTRHLARTRGRDETRAALGFAPSDFVLGYLGRFSAEKRPHLVIEAVARLPRHYKALLVGQGPEYRNLTDLANARIPGRFAFARAAGDLGDYYAALDAACLLSEEEGFGMVVVEAMLCERPVIATPVGCVPDLVEDRVNGLVVDGRPESVAAAARLLANHPAWARGLAVEARIRAEDHGYARTMARKYEDLIWSLWRQKTRKGNSSPERSRLP